MAGIFIGVQKRLHGAEGAFDLDISIHAQSSDCVALFGPSGAGKTTLLRMIAGLTAPDKGRIVFGETVWFDSSRRIDVPPQNRSAGLVFQDYALFPSMTVEQNIRFGSKGDSSAVETLLETFKLGGLRRRLPKTLSGGQQQRVALARALAAKPAMLLLDEPLSALDPSMRNELQTELLAARRIAPVPAVLVSHDCGEIFQLANRVLRIAGGRVTADGSPQEVFGSSGDRLRVTGEVLAKSKEGAISVVTIAVGEEVSRIAVSHEEAAGLGPGDRVSVSVKAFNPDVTKINLA